MIRSTSQSFGVSIGVADLLADTFQIEFTDEQLAAAFNSFFLQYGKTMAAWSSVEDSMSTLFAFLSGVPQRMASAIFYSARAYNGRSDMVAAALAASSVSPSLQSHARAAIKKAHGYSAFRNALAHGHAIFDAVQTSPSFLQMVLMPGDRGDKITVEQMAAAELNFQALAYAVAAVDSDAAEDVDTLPETSREQLLQLPTLAYSREYGTTPAKQQKRAAIISAVSLGV